MSMNRNWPRWLITSLCKHFNSLRDDIHLIIEGQDVLDLTVKDRLELAVNGPMGDNLSPTLWKLKLEVVILASATLDDDRYKIYTSVGIAASGFARQIPVYKYGNTAYDDDSLLGCLKLDGPLEINHYGRPDPVTEILQSSVKGNYTIHLDS